MADPSAGGSSSPLREPKTEYDEELDFFSTKFNPERALYTANLSVPDPCTKSFESIKQYEDAVKARSKLKAGSKKSKTSEKRHVDTARETELIAPTKTEECIHVKASSSSESSTGCDTRHVRLVSKDKLDKKGKLPVPLLSPKTEITEEAAALDLSVKTPMVSAQAVSTGVGWPSATPLENYGKPPSSTSSRYEEKPYQTSVEHKINMLLSSSRAQSSHEKPSTSSRTTESSGSHLVTPSRKSQSTARSDNSGHILATNLGVQNVPSNYDKSSPGTFIKTEESDFIYLPRSEKPVRVSGLTDERRSHSASTQSRSAEKQHFDPPRHQERSSRETPKFSRYKEKSPDVLLARSQERSSHAPTYSQRPPGWRDDRHSSHSAERQEVVSDNRKNPRPGTSRHQVVQATDSADAIQKPKTRNNVLVRMEKMTGPLRLLTRCTQEQLQVRVMTRGAKGVNSICRGYIVAFDKHFNMALVDVDEIYRRPVALGKVKSKRSKKLLAAQKTLQKEREAYVAKWNDEQSIQRASSSLQDLTLQAASSSDHKLSSDVSKHQEGVPTGVINPFVTQFHQTGNLSSESRHASAVKGKAASSQYPGSVEKEVPNPFKRLSQAAQVKLRRIQSVYEGQRIPLSPFEREALMLGIADENVNHRHINKVFIRGENIASVSIIEDI